MHTNAAAAQPDKRLRLCPQPFVSGGWRASRVAVVVAAAALACASCTPTYQTSGGVASADLRTLVLEQGGAIEDLRREVEELRGTLDELQHGQRKPGAVAGYPAGERAPEAGEWYPGGRQETPSAPGAPDLSSEPTEPAYDEDEDADALASVPGFPAPGEAGSGTTGGSRDLELPTVPQPLAGTVYEVGVRSLVAGDHDGAIQSFRDYLRENPSSRFADDSQYWIGEAYFRKGQYHRAIIEFNQVVIGHGSGDRAAGALLRQAEVFRIVGDRVDARLSLQKVLSRYPNTPEAERASRLLGEIGG